MHQSSGHTSNGTCVTSGRYKKTDCRSSLPYLYHPSFLIYLDNTAVESMLRTLLSLGLVAVAMASPNGLLESRQMQYVDPGTDGPTSASCLSLRNSCNATTVDLSNFYNYVSCIMLTTCLQGVENPAQVLQGSGAPANQPRLTEQVGIITQSQPIITKCSEHFQTFYSMSNGNPYMTQQNYIDAYYGAISHTPNGTYPDK